MDTCIFCKIAQGRLPADTIYENDSIVAFLDIRPISRGHALLVPKTHVERYSDLSDAAASELACALKVLGPGVSRAVGAHGFNLALNNGPAAGQIVPHVHWHIIPRSEGDNLVHWPNRSMGADELRATAESIRKAL